MPSITDLGFSLNRRQIELPNRSGDFESRLEDNIPTSIMNQMIPPGSIDFDRLTVNVLKVAQYIQSANFRSGLFGFKIEGGGHAEFLDALIGGWIIDATRIYSATLELDSANERIRSLNYVSGTFGQGFSINNDWAEFGNISARGMIRTANFQKNIISAIAGGQVIAHDCSTLDVDIATGDTSITIKSESVFSELDVLRIKEGIQDEYMIVSDADSAPTYKVYRMANYVVNVFTFNSLTADGGTWAGFSGTASVDTSDYTDGSGSIKLVTDGGTNPQIYNNTVSKDITGYKDSGKFVMKLYIGNLTAMGVILLRMLSSAGNYYDLTGQRVGGGSLKIGWNLIEFSFLSGEYSQTGTPDDAAIDNWLIAVIQSPATTGITYGFDALWFKYTVTALSWKKGATIVDYGRVNQGLIYQTASEANSPYQDIFVHKGDPWYSPNNTTKVRVGNLAGITDSDFGGALSGYGIYTQNGYFKGNVDVGNNGSVKGGQSDYAVGTGFFEGKSSGVYKHSVGSPTQYSRFDGVNNYFSGAMILNAPLGLPAYTVANLPIPPTASAVKSASSNTY